VQAVQQLLEEIEHAQRVEHGCPMAASFDVGARSRPRSNLSNAIYWLE
jgi:hypothetical protein